ncbi:MAG: hypothetical protein ABIK89_01250 [Planctomycetota bacterium]
MFKPRKTMIIGLALVGAVAMGGAIYATTALAAGGASASAAAQAVQTPNGAQLRSTVLDMLTNRMGLTGPEAERFADEMIARMQNVDQDFDFQAMIDRCNEYVTDDDHDFDMMDGDWGMMDGAGWDMMEGWDMMDGDWDMMDGDWGYGDWGMMKRTAPDGGLSDPSAGTQSGPGFVSGSPGLTPGQMMDAMMNGDASTYPGGNAPTGSGPQNPGSDFTPGGMMGGTMGGLTGGGTMGGVTGGVTGGGMMGGLGSR